ncbi:hypothetical protein NGRA_0400 [Nosema granulosis]|uniref:Leptin receptor gene-related protein n=1 Tax=Nosema granulosis TaxID=83296 RepID=A0A9P6KZL7_9MICR|nr:hypothetical protein NGRA_0400 [Nosema granulosis]
MDNQVANEGVVHETYTKIRWSLFKIIVVLILFAGGGACIYFGLSPLLEMEFEMKNFANLVFVIFHIYYILSFFGVKKTSQFVFWCASYILLIFASLMFYFYDDVFV